MKNLSASKHNKLIKKTHAAMAQTGVKFFPKNRMCSDDHSIINQIFVQEHRKSNSKSIETLQHFRKNNNKIEVNLQQEKRTPYRGIKTIKFNKNRRSEEQGQYIIGSEIRKESRNEARTSHNRNFTLDIIIPLQEKQKNLELPFSREKCQRTLDILSYKENARTADVRKQKAKQSMFQIKRQMTGDKPRQATLDIRPRQLENSMSIVRDFKMYPRYKIFELFSLYQSILKFSQKKPQKFLQAFESILNYKKILIKPEILKKNVYEVKKMDFRCFLQMFKKMEDLMFIQSIVDYLDIIFQVYSTVKMSFRMVLEVLCKRSEVQFAKGITTLIFESLGIDLMSTISLDQMIGLCQRDLQFCVKFANVYLNQTRRNG